MPNKLRVLSVLFTFAIASVLAVVATSSAQETQPQPSGGQTQKPTIDDEFATVASRAPAFGGAYIDEGKNTVYIFLTDLSTTASQAAISQLKNTFGDDLFEQRSIRTLHAQYDFAELKIWYDLIATRVLSTPGVVLADIDDAKNRIRIGVTGNAKREPVDVIVAAAGIPTDAVSVEIVPPVDLESNLQDYHRPLVGGLQIEYSSYMCTLGFNVIRQGVEGFITNSHCSDVQGGVEGTAYYQDGIGIGTESVDPTYFTGGSCPTNRRCRYSDSLFAEKLSGTTASVGRIANSGTSTPPTPPSWDGTSTYRIVGERENIFVGEMMTKVGRSTGKTQGSVSGTCVDVNVSGSDITLLCQTQAGYLSAGGDSGSPVFRITNDPTTNDVNLYGIHWGSGGYFSPIRTTNMKRSDELGGFITADPNICPGCQDWDHYYVWRSGSEATSRAVLWAGNRFVARFNKITSVKFNSGGGSSGYADAAIIRIYSDPNFITKVGETTVADINDYSETTATFASPVSVNTGKYYYLKIQPSGAARIHLYSSLYGSTDYTEGCIYIESTTPNCNEDLNGIVLAPSS